MSIVIRRVLALRPLVNCLTKVCLLLASPAGTPIVTRVIRLLCLSPPPRRAMFRPPKAIALLGRSFVGISIDRPLLNALTLRLRFSMV